VHHHDRGNGARARSARIRSSHDYEATQLDSMRRGTLALEETAARPSFLARTRATLGRLRPRHRAEEAPEAPPVRI
jgi:hypothetical protein